MSDEPVEAIKAAAAYLRENAVKFGTGQIVYNEHGRMISDLLDYIQKLRGVIREANIRLRSPDSGTTSAAPHMLPAGQELPKWRHVKRGSVVTEIARGFAQVAIHPIEEFTAVVIYRHDEDGRYWVRNAVEFDDGRFTRIIADHCAEEKS